MSSGNGTERDASGSGGILRDLPHNAQVRSSNLLSGSQVREVLLALTRGPSRLVTLVTVCSNPR